MTYVAKNNVVVGTGAAAFSSDGQSWAGSEFNMSDDGTAPGPNSVPGVAANEFLNITAGFEDLHLKPTSAAINAGTNLSGNFTNDIDDETRGSTWDMGADEVAVTVNYRSIGTAADYSANTVTTTNGSPLVTGDTTLWSTNNRGRGDVITIPCPNPPTCTGGTDYTVLRVDSETQLTLTMNFSGTDGPGLTYTISRQYTTLQAWETCISGGGGCTYFPVVGGDLVVDNRREVGIAYDDSAVPADADFTAGVIIDGSTTDADHDITLTADGGNRHYGLEGQGTAIQHGR